MNYLLLPKWTTRPAILLLTIAIISSIPLFSNTRTLTQPPVADPAEFPEGYYNGDELPPSTIYLTFDDGPSDFTPAILDILKEKGVNATFFINSFVRGAKRGQNPFDNALLAHTATLKRMIADGNVIGNHTFSHRNLATQSPETIIRELDMLNQHLHEALGTDCPTIHLFRPPFGSPWLGRWNKTEFRSKVAPIISERGILMMWGHNWDSTDSAEWVSGEWYKASSVLYKPDTPAYQKKTKRILDYLLHRADGTASGIILMHDVHPTTRDMLAQLIDELRMRGYVFQTLEDYAKWRWGAHVFDRFHLDDPNALPKPPPLSGIAQALLSQRPFPPDQATAPRLSQFGRIDQATAPRVSIATVHPPRLAIADWSVIQFQGKSPQNNVADLPVWFPLPILPPPSDSLMASGIMDNIGAD